MIFMETVGMILCGGFGKRLRPITEKIQDEFYRIYALNDIEQLKRFHAQLDIIAEGYRAQAVTTEV